MLDIFDEHAVGMRASMFQPVGTGFGGSSTSAPTVGRWAVKASISSTRKVAWVAVKGARLCSVPAMNRIEATPASLS